MWRCGCMTGTSGSPGSGKTGGFQIPINPARSRASRPLARRRTQLLGAQKEQGASPLAGAAPWLLLSDGRVLLLFLGLLLHLVAAALLVPALLLAALLLARLHVVGLLLLGLGGRGLGDREARRAESEGNAHHQRNDLLHFGFTSSPAIRSAHQNNLSLRLVTLLVSDTLCQDFWLWTPYGSGD